MTHFFRRVCQACLLIMFFPGAYAQQVAPSPNYLELYRSRDCAQLKTSGAELEDLFKRSEAQWNQPGLPNLSAEHRAYEQQLRREGLAELDKKKAGARAALAMSIAEKQCDFSPSSAAQSTTPRPLVAQQPGLQATPGAALPAKQTGAGLLPQIGLRIDAVSPGFAQSLGLTQARGALVVDVESGSTADKAGLRALDVIVEITGQGVQSPDDLRESLSRMRPGFKAPLRVWRSKAMRDVVVVIAGDSGAVLTRSGPAVATIPPAAGAERTAQPAALPEAAYCYAWARPASPELPIVSRFFELPLKSGTFDDAVIKAHVVGFNAVLVAMPNTRFRELPRNEALNCSQGACIANFGSGLFSTGQMTVVTCNMDRAKIEAMWKVTSRAHEQLDWPPKQ